VTIRSSCCEAVKTSWADPKRSTRLKRVRGPTPSSMASRISQSEFSTDSCMGHPSSWGIIDRRGSCDEIRGGCVTKKS